MVQAHNYANTADHLPHISQIIEQELPTVLLPEFITSLLLLHTRIGLKTQLSTVFSVLRDLLELLDKFNKLAPNIALEDSEDLAWPGGLGKTGSVSLSFERFCFLSLCPNVLIVKTNKCENPLVV